MSVRVDFGLPCLQNENFEQTLSSFWIRITGVALGSIAVGLALLALYQCPIPLLSQLEAKWLLSVGAIGSLCIIFSVALRCVPDTQKASHIPSHPPLQQKEESKQHKKAEGAKVSVNELPKKGEWTLLKELNISVDGEEVKNVKMQTAPNGNLIISKTIANSVSQHSICYYDLKWGEEQQHEIILQEPISAFFWKDDDWCVVANKKKEVVVLKPQDETSFRYGVVYQKPIIKTNAQIISLHVVREKIFALCEDGDLIFFEESSDSPTIIKKHHSLDFKVIEGNPYSIHKTKNGIEIVDLHKHHADGHEITISPIDALKLSKVKLANNKVVCIFNTGAIKVYSLSGEELAVFTIDTAFYKKSDMAFSKLLLTDQYLFAQALNNWGPNFIQIWDLESGECVQEVKKDKTDCHLHSASDGYVILEEQHENQRTDKRLVLYKVLLEDIKN